MSDASREPTPRPSRLGRARGGGRVALAGVVGGVLGAGAGAAAVGGVTVRGAGLFALVLAGLAGAAVAGAWAGRRFRRDVVGPEEPYELVVADLAGALIAASRTADAERTVVEAVTTLVPATSPAIAGLWRSEGGLLRLVASAGHGPWTLPARLDPLELPARVEAALETGRLTRTEAATLAPGQVTGQDPGQATLVPLAAEGLGEGLLCLLTSSPVEEAAGRALLRIAGKARLALERSASLDSLRRTEALFRTIAANSSDVFLVVGEDLRVRYVSPAVEDLLGSAPAALTHRQLQSFLDAETVAMVVRVLEGGESGPTRHRARLAGEPEREVDVVAHRVSDTAGAPVAMLTIRDQAEREWLRAEVNYRAHHDPLTGLPNRGMFTNRLETALEHCRESGGMAAVAVIDLDQFKAINDGLGHDIGDALLAELGRRLADACGLDESAARLGGDEFGVLLEEVRGVADAERRIAAVLTEVGRQFVIHDRAVFTRTSTGVVLSRGGMDDPPELLRKADVAMYAAKERGKGGFVVFDPGLHLAAVEELALQVDLEGGMERGEFTLAYQPVVDLRTGRPAGVEALVRWHHPRKGLLGPDAFISLAERSGLIGPLGRWIVGEACRQVARLGAPELTVNVNLSARQFQHGTLVEDVREALRASGLDPARLTLEVTESVLLHQSEHTLALLRSLKDLGVSLAIDDFGTGYSSFGYLRERMIDVVKIDRSFIEGVARGPEDSALAHAILKLSHGLGMRAVAEGVEDADQVAQLKAWSCDYGQGYYFSPPLELHALVVYLDRHGVHRVGAGPGQTELTGPRIT